MTIPPMTVRRNEQGHIVTEDGRLVALAHQTATVLTWWLQASSHVGFRRQYQAALDLLAREAALASVSCPDGGTHHIIPATPSTGSPRCVGCGETVSALLARQE